MLALLEPRLDPSSESELLALLFSMAKLTETFPETDAFVRIIPSS
jgi:hypothetical protein